jgi:hypothetical protein
MREVLEKSRSWLAQASGYQVAVSYDAGESHFCVVSAMAKVRTLAVLAGFSNQTAYDLGVVEPAELH